jgi:hypothetical protein
MLVDVAYVECQLMQAPRRMKPPLTSLHEDRSKLTAIGVKGPLLVADEALTAFVSSCQWMAECQKITNLLHEVY